MRFTAAWYKKLTTKFIGNDSFKIILFKTKLDSSIYAKKN